MTHKELNEHDLSASYLKLREFVDALLAPFPGPASESVRHYFQQRAEAPGAVWRDLLPQLSYQGLGADDTTLILPVSAAWSLALASAHFFDAVQDRGDLPGLNGGTVALGCANLALSHLETNTDTLRALLAAIGQVTILGANAQGRESNGSSIRTRQAYLTDIAGKAAALVAIGVWLGGRLAAKNDQELQILKSLGLALGMAMQLNDDCIDLAEDLTAGLLTLPVIEALTMTDHPHHAVLTELIREQPVVHRHADEIIECLKQMGTIDKTRQLARAYQIQVAAGLKMLPGLIPYFGHHVGF